MIYFAWKHEDNIVLLIIPAGTKCNLADQESAKPSREYSKHWNFPQKIHKW